MSTDERTQILELERQERQSPDDSVTCALRAPTEFPPHDTVDLRGALACSQPVSRTEAEVVALCAPALADLVRQVITWGMNFDNPDARIGDFRFLVVEFTDAAEICRYAQIWSEPRGDITVEVGPGDRDDERLQAEAEAIRPAMAARGFATGGGARNFRKFLSGGPRTESEAVATELLGLLTQVLGYDGTSDLSYRLHQGSHLCADHVVYGINRSQLVDWLLAWGLRPEPISDIPTLIVARDRDLLFRVMLQVPKQGAAAAYWEIHGFVTLTFPAARAASMLADLNAKPNLFKVFAASPPADDEQEVGIAVGINLAGGVTPAHIRSQILEWLDSVRALRQIPPVPPAQAPQLTPAEGQTLN